MAIPWVCWADLAIERLVHRTSPTGRARLDTHEAELLCRQAQMLLNRGPSWRQGSRPQPVDQVQNFSEQSSGDSDLRALKGDVAAMSHDLGTDLDQPLPECRQRPVLDLLRQRQCAQEVAEVISERMELKPNRIVAETMAGKACPVDGVFALLDVLLGRAATIVEPGDALGWQHRLVTMKPTRGYSSPGRHATFATTRRGLLQVAA